ncbi:hypothetical protein Leryth_011848 [Lithospermum erythrorhizon]|nr:hypothetical protein Leryth_011848 [Lithospermum erythrorhizon]
MSTKRSISDVSSSKKKMKKEKLDKHLETQKNSDAQLSISAEKLGSLKPMERRKHRKSIDKERNQKKQKIQSLLQKVDEISENTQKNESLLSKDDENSEKKEDLVQEVDESSENNRKMESFEHKDDENGYMSVDGSSSSKVLLPEFHIGVFKDLAAADCSVREEAAATLLTELIDVQKAYELLDDKEGVVKLEAVKDDGLDECAPSVRYAVRRLIRGVSSSRECARQGFALGLTILVGAVPSIKLGSLLKLIINLLEVTSSMKGQEAKDCLFGRLFAYGALARSGRLIGEWDSNKDTPFIKEFVKSVIYMAMKKRYLQEASVSILLELVEKLLHPDLPVVALSNQVLGVPELQEWFIGAADVGNPDALLLALKLRERLGVDDDSFGKLLPRPYSSNLLFSTDHLNSLSSCLKESTFCQPRVHGVWPLLIDIMLPENVLQDVDPAAVLNSAKKHKKSRKGSSAEEDIKNNLQNFSEVIIEGSLLTSSHDRKHLAFDVMLLILHKLPSSCTHVLLSYKVVQCLMDILSTEKSWLYKVAEHFLKELSEWAKHDDIRNVAVIVALQKHSNGKFDNITRTRTVKDLMAEFKTESGCLLLIQNLMNMFLDEGNLCEEPSDQSITTDDNSEIGSIEGKDSVASLGASEFLKSWIVEYLPSILKYLKLDPDSNFRVEKEIMKFLAVQGIFSSSLGTEVTSFELQEKFRWPKSAISNSLRLVCIEQLQSLLANVQKGERPLVVSDEKAFKKLQALETSLSRERRICGLSTDEINKFHAMKYLLIQLLLQILLRPGEFSEAALELTICCKKAFTFFNLQELSEDDEPADDEPKIMDVLVDTMLSILPESSAPMRSTIEQVFKYFCDEITDDGLMRMLRVIKKDLKPARHQETVDEDEEEEEDDDLLGIEEAEESDEAETGETGESDGQTDDTEAVINIPTANAELPEDSDESDDGMDDDEMFRMDTYLARIFKERKNQTGGETAQSQLILFKLRVLSLLEIYLHENPGKAQALKVFSNLVQAFVNPHTTEGSEQLAQRIWGILQKKVLKAKEFPKYNDVELSTLESLLEKNLKLAAKPFKRKKSSSTPSKRKLSISLNRHKMITSLAQNSTFWILKIIDARNFSEPELQRVLDILKSVFKTYFDSKKSHLKPEFLKEVLKRRPWIGHHLIGFLLEQCSSAKMQYRRVEALEFINEIFRTLVSANVNDSTHATTKKRFKSLVPKLCHLTKVLVTNMPEKQARRADVRKFCSKVFQILKNLKLTSSFLKGLEPDTLAACESQLGDTFLALKKQEQ